MVIHVKELSSEQGEPLCCSRICFVMDFDGEKGAAAMEEMKIARTADNRIKEDIFI